MSQNTGRIRNALEVAATVAVIVLCGILAWERLSARRALPPEPTRPLLRPESPLPLEPISLHGAARKGASTARVALIQYSDFQCPYCGVFARDTLPALEAEYVATGKVRLAFRNLPLDAIHPIAKAAAQAAQCAGLFDKFWEMHDWIFRNQPGLSEDTLRAKGQALSQDAPRFDVCLSGESMDAIQADQTQAMALGINGTPTFFLGVMTTTGDVAVKYRFTGAKTKAEFAKAIESLLAGEAK